MNHSYFQDRLSAYADQELTPEEQAAVAEHVRGCAECTRRLQELSRLSELVGRHSNLDESAYWAQAARKIEDRLAEGATEVVDLAAERSRRRSGIWWKFPAAAASVLILGYIGLHQSDIFRDESTIPPREMTTPVIVPADKPVELTDTTKKRGRTGREGKRADQSGGQVSRETESVTAMEKHTFEAKAEGEAPRPAAGSPGSSSVEAAKLKGERERSAVSSPNIQENYKLDQPKNGAAILEETAEISSVPSEEVRLLSDSAADDSVISELAYWREQRDSLSTVGDEVYGQSSGRMKTAAAPQSDLKPAPAPLSARRESQRHEARLVEAWYHICRLSPDSTETQQGKEYLRRVAADEASANRDIADHYLKLLERQ